MKTVNLKLTGSENLDNTIIYVDNSPIKFKCNEFKNMVGTFQTDKDNVNIKIYKILDVGGIWWFITQLFFFIISILGLLDIHSKNKALSLKFECEVNLQDNNNITLSCNKPSNNAKAFNIETDLQTNEIENSFYIDESAKKKFKWLLIAKIITALAIVAIAIIITITKFK